MVWAPVFRGSPAKPLWIQRDGIMVPAWSEDPCVCCELEPADCECPPCTDDFPNWPPTAIFTIDGLGGPGEFLNNVPFVMHHEACGYIGFGEIEGLAWAAEYNPCGATELIPAGGIRFGVPPNHCTFNHFTDSPYCISGFSVSGDGDDDVVVEGVCIFYGPGPFTLTVEL